MKQKILITGATGMVGQKLCELLFRNNYEIVAVTRNKKESHALIGVPATLVNWDEIPQYVKQNSIYAAINLAGESIASGLWTKKRKISILKSRVNGTRNLMQALKKNPPQKIISASAIGYYGDRDSEVLTEKSNPGNLWISKVCEQWEAAATENSPKESELTLLRIGAVLGNPGGMLDLLAPVFATGLGGPTGFGKTYLSWIHIHDLVRLMSFILQDDTKKTRTSKPVIINAVSPNPVTNREFSKSLARVFGKPAIIPTPPAALRLILGELSTIILSSQRVEPRALPADFQFKFPHLPTALRNLFPYSFYAAKLERNQWIKQPIENVFSFFSSETNLERITPKFLNFKVVRKSTPRLQEGTRIDYQLKLHGIPLKWRSKIEDWRPGEEFVDIQEKGPYSYWHHRHLFESIDSGTLIKDVIHYRLPFLPIVHLFARPFISKNLAKIFNYRYVIIEELFP